MISIVFAPFPITSHVHVKEINNFTLVIESNIYYSENLKPNKTERR